MNTDKITEVWPYASLNLQFFLLSKFYSRAMRISICITLQYIQHLKISFLFKGILSKRPVLMLQRVMFPIIISSGHFQRTDGQLRLSNIAVKSVHTLCKVNHAQTHLTHL